MGVDEKEPKPRHGASADPLETGAGDGTTSGVRERHAGEAECRERDGRRGGLIRIHGDEGTADELTAAQVERIRGRIRDGFYDSPHVVDRVVRAILARGEC